MSGNRFEGKVLLATGAGSGLGAATARRFAAEGGRVAVLDLDAGSAVAAPSPPGWGGAGGGARRTTGSAGSTAS
jgi:NAD(P)-dependent dehydrogenase (short-subunit alcohol dehydrogenase family)